MKYMYLNSTKSNVRWGNLKFFLLKKQDFDAETFVVVAHDLFCLHSKIDSKIEILYEVEAASSITT